LTPLEPDRQPRNGAAPQRPTTILVVDDREQNRLLIQQLFDSPEYRVREAADGAAGIAQAQAERPDCILLDLEMPGLGGFEVLERLEQDPRTREIPVIIITAAADSIADMERALRGGAVDYITKPISPARVAIRVRGAIERRRLLQEIQDLRASFTSMLVHDLRGPLTVILGYIELLEQSSAIPTNDRLPRYIRSIRGACDKMLTLIAQILDLSKLEAVGLTLERRPIDLGDLVGAMVERFQPATLNKSLRVEIDRPPNMAPVPADPFRIEEVLMNLLTNALKFTPAGGTVRVAVSELGEQVEVAVENDGPGIAPEEMPLLFERFGQTRTGKTGQTKSQGTGLGLVICRYVVEAHGGRIWAESEAGRGTRFVFRLPRSSQATSLAELASPGDIEHRMGQPSRP
jgi:signal transduction histidine kinase